MRAPVPPDDGTDEAPRGAAKGRRGRPGYSGRVYRCSAGRFLGCGVLNSVGHSIARAVPAGSIPSFRLPKKSLGSDGQREMVSYQGVTEKADFRKGAWLARESGLVPDRPRAGPEPCTETAHLGVTGPRATQARRAARCRSGNMPGCRF